VSKDSTRPSGRPRQYKTGKTTFYCGLARSLADGSDFLGTLPVQPAVRRVGFWNCEMDEDDFLDYIQTVGIMNTDKIELLHLQGQPVRLMTEAGMNWAINWLIDNDVEIWLNDSWAKLCAWSDVDENDNTGVGRLTSVIDEIKKQTKITEQFITTAHTGRVKQPEGDERARGATALDDWVDSRMVLTREGENRFLFAEGRGKVEMLETKLIFDPATNLNLIGQGDRKATREVANLNTVVDIVTASPGMNTRSLSEAVRERIPSHNQEHASKAIATAKRLGLVHTVDGRNNAKLFHLGPDPAWAVQQQWADTYARR
jgi:AAA domain